MTITQTDTPSSQKPLRLWPGVVIAVLLLLSMFVLPVIVPKALIFGMLGGLVSALAILVWWVFFSRARWFERLGAIVLMIVAIFATRFVVHESIAGAGMGMMFPIFGLMSVSVALVVGVVIGRRLSDGAAARRPRCVYPARVRSVDARPDGRHHRHRRFGLGVALVADS